MSASASPVARKPRVGVTACNRLLGAHEFHVAGRKYVDAVRLAGGLPLVLPPVAADDLDALLDALDGVLLTGSPSNVHPGHFGEDVFDAALPLDAARDASNLPLIRRALERGVPLFGICRGFQETNVALGGSLHQAIAVTPGLSGHDSDDGRVAPDVAYGPAHAVTVQPGGVLSRVIAEPSFAVNSVHGQGANRLAPGLRIEALADDGLVEAFSVPAAPAFNLCVQWHPEWQASTNAVSARLFAAFGDACRARLNGHDRR